MDGNSMSTAAGVAGAGASGLQDRAPSLLAPSASSFTMGGVTPTAARAVEASGGSYDPATIEAQLM